MVFFSLLLYREVKLRSNQTFGWECMWEESLSNFQTISVYYKKKL